MKPTTCNTPIFRKIDEGFNYESSGSFRSENGAITKKLRPKQYREENQEEAGDLCRDLRLEAVKRIEVVMSGMAWELSPGYVVNSNNIKGGPIHVFSPPKMETFRGHAGKSRERPTYVFSILGV
ncbi:hypothetical protein L6452_42743 [Arctium lappa]|uniref:Uncharacterized protein n=1 Tax=Arctium lappa TaxID=4217 RepID=A0ACB8XJM5_ARCLA|nr:hypothetical protein L6452_42743 [Arctium lappa]